MKIGKKFFLALLGISLAILAVVAGAGIIQLASLRTSIANVHNAQSEVLAETNLEVLTSYNKDVVTALVQVYTEKLENKFASIINQLLIVSGYLENSYSKGIETQSHFDESGLNLRSGVTFADVEEEFRIIQSVQDLISFILVDNEFMFMYFATESGMMIENQVSTYDGIDFRDMYWYMNAVEKGGIYWSQVNADIYTGELIVTVSVPVYDPQGVLMGVVGYDISVVYLAHVILGITTDIINLTFLMDEHRDFLLGSVPERDYSYFIEEERTRLALHEAMQEHTNGAGLFAYEEVIAGFAIIPTTGWHVGVLVDFERISEPIMQIDEAVGYFGAYFMEHLERAMMVAITIFITIAVAIVLVSVFISRKVTRSITRPIETLALGVSKVSAGDLEHKIEVNTGNELETLANAFNSMTESLCIHIENLLIMRADNERISTELNIATQIQVDMLPNIFPLFPERLEFDTYATMHSAKEVGGDFYDIFLIDQDHLAVVIADVSDKGIPAALFMVITKTLLKNSAQSGLSPEESFEAVNNILCESNEVGMFVTAFMGYLHIPSGRFTYVNAGHNPPLIKRAGEGFEFLNIKTAFVLAGMKDIKYSQQELTLNSGDMLYLYTDGVTEAMNEKDELYGEGRLAAVLNSMPNESLHEILSNIKSDIDNFAHGVPQADDITMLGLLFR